MRREILMGPSRLNRAGSPWQEKTSSDKEFAQVNTGGCVNIENGDGSSAASSATHEPRSVPLEVTFPRLPPGIEKNNDSFRDGVVSAEIARFREIAMEAGPGQVVRSVRA